MAFGGTGYNSGARGNGRGGYGNNTYGNGYNNGYNNGGGYNNGYGGWGGGWGYGNDWLYPYYGAAYPYFGYDYDGPGYTYSGPSDYSLNNTSSVSAQVQQDLAQQGYYQGPIDGIVGRGTQSAIAAYQRANGLPVTGAIDGGLLHSLGLN